MFKRAKIVRPVNWLLKFSTVFGRQDVARPAESRRQLRTAKEADHATLPLMTDRGQEPRKIGRIAPSALFEAQLELHQRITEGHNLNHQTTQEGMSTIQG